MIVPKRKTVALSKGEAGIEEVCEAHDFYVEQDWDLGVENRPLTTAAAAYEERNSIGVVMKT